MRPFYEQGIELFYWQTRGRSDLSYIENWSLSFDLRIMSKTLQVVLEHKGAY